MTDIYSVSVTCHWPLRSPHLHPAAENIMLSHVCCVMQATFSLQVLKHSSCPRVKSSKFLHCLPASRGLMLTHTLTDCTHMLPPVLTPVAATCPSQSVAANNEFTQPHTHTQTCLTIADPAATCPPPTPRPTNQTPTHTAVSLRLVA